MWPFRRKAGKHQLGAAVTSIPSLPRPAAPPIPVYDGPVAAPVQPAAPEAAPVVPVQSPTVEQPAEPEAVLPPYEPPVSAEPRIELGFRDGSTAALAPGSDQARALNEIASVLTQRD